LFEQQRQGAPKDFLTVALVVVRYNGMTAPLVRRPLRRDAPAAADRPTYWLARAGWPACKTWAIAVGPAGGRCR